MTRKPGDTEIRVGNERDGGVSLVWRVPYFARRPCLREGGNEGSRRHVPNDDVDKLGSINCCGLLTDAPQKPKNHTRARAVWRWLRTERARAAAVTPNTRGTRRGSRRRRW